MKYTFLGQQCSLACHLPGGLGIHQIRTKAEWTFTFENPLVFYFLLALSQHLLGKNCFVAGRFTVWAAVQSILHSSASRSLSSFLTVPWENWPSSVRRLGEDCGWGGASGCTTLGASIVLPLQG